MLLDVDMRTAAAVRDALGREITSRSLRCEELRDRHRMRSRPDAPLDTRTANAIAKHRAEIALLQPVHDAAVNIVDRHTADLVNKLTGEEPEEA